MPGDVIEWDRREKRAAKVGHLTQTRMHLMTGCSLNIDLIVSVVPRLAVKVL
jgi:hypothetical protein